MPQDGVRRPAMPLVVHDEGKQTATPFPGRGVVATAEGDFAAGCRGEVEDPQLDEQRS